MPYDVLVTAHHVGAMLIVAGLIGVFVGDLRGRRADTRAAAARAASQVALFYDAVVVPGAIVLAASGGILIVTVYGMGVFEQPWLAAMIVLFGLEFIEGNTITRLAFLRLKKLSRAEGPQAQPALTKARQSRLAAFTHFLDLPMVSVIIGLGLVRPMEWAPILLSLGAALTVAAALTVIVPRLVPWRS